MDDHAVKTPWGFTMEQAFEAMSFRAVVLNDTDPQNKYSPDREEYNTVNMAGLWHACRYPTCLNPRYQAKLCTYHWDRLVAYRTRRKEEQKRKAQEEKAALEELQRRNRWLAQVEYQMHWREVKSQVPIIKAARLEYRAEKAARGRRYSGPPRTGYVYRLYDANKALLYVGKTYSLKSRLFGQGGHVHKDWFSEAMAVHVVEYRSEADALLAEGFAIRRESPRYNVMVPAQKTSRAPRKVSEYWELVSALV